MLRRGLVRCRHCCAPSTRRPDRTLRKCARGRALERRNHDPEPRSLRRLRRERVEQLERVVEHRARQAEIGEEAPDALAHRTSAAPTSLVQRVRRLAIFFTWSCDPTKNDEINLDEEKRAKNVATVPTTMGKELAVLTWRLQRQLARIEAEAYAKLGQLGASPLSSRQPRLNSASPEVSR